MIRFILLYVLLAHSFLAGEDIYLLGHPRSGNHWLSYCLVQLLGRPCLSHPGTDHPFYWMSHEHKEKVSFDGSETQPVFYHAHNPVDLNLSQANPDEDWLILLVRDYKETLMSDNYDRQDVAIQRIKSERLADPNNPYLLRNNLYLNNLLCYHFWNPEKRILIYYEDLVDNPEPVFSNLCQKLEIKSESLTQFLDDLDNHRHFSLKTTRNRLPDVFDFKRHTKLMSEECRVTIDHFFQNYMAEIADLYLRRYAE